jgi:hypothetical protein
MLRTSRYQDSHYDYCDLFPPRVSLNPDYTTSVFFPRDDYEFRAFSTRENAFSIVLFAHHDDPRMAQLFELLLPFSNVEHKLIVVDVGSIPTLGQSYAITRPTIMKIFKQQMIEVFDQPNCSTLQLAKFINTATSVRFRKTESR